jgi:hypothetical protein
MKDTTMYNLDIETMIQIMQTHQQTGFLQADIPPKTAGVRESRQVNIAISSGSIVSCTITYSDGRQRTGKEAHQELVRLGRLRWTFTLQSGLPTQPQPPSHNPVENSLSPPRRTASPEQQVIRSWPRVHRQVFALVDGTKCCEKIAEILSTPPNVIDQVLRDLQKMQVILFRKQDARDHS